MDKNRQNIVHKAMYDMYEDEKQGDYVETLISLFDQPLRVPSNITEEEQVMDLPKSSFPAVKFANSCCCNSMTGSTTMLEENRGIWPWRGNRWEIWASSKNLGNLSTGHWEGARLGKDLGSGGRDEEREGHAVLGHREWKDGRGWGSQD